MTQPQYTQDVEDAIKKLGFNAFSANDALQGAKRAFIILDLLLSLIGSIALAVSSLGIVNTMVMSILERTREIGIMKAIGGSDADIRRIFLVEASAIGCFGGVAGVALGWLVGRAINIGANIYISRQGGTAASLFSLPFWLIGGAIGFSVAISLHRRKLSRPPRCPARSDPGAAPRLRRPNMTTLKAGQDPVRARLAAILVHGRGGSAGDMLGLAEALSLDDVAFVAPEAPGRTWYPNSFLAPLADNEPGITQGLATLAAAMESLHSAGLPAGRVALIGFSQGACLSLEFAARNATRYAAVIGLSGGLIGPPGTPRNYPGSMSGTPLFLGCSDIDPHIPVERVHESAAVFRVLGGAVDERIYPRMGHTVNADELRAVREIVGSAAAAPRPPSA